MSWYYASNKQQLGPISEEELQQKVAAGQVSPSTLVWQEGMTDWKPLSQVKTMSSLQAPPGMVRCLCGGVFPQTDTVRIGERWVCASCKDTAVQQLKEGVATGASAMNYAGFWIRFAAKFIDGILLGVVNFTLQMGFTFGIAAMGHGGDESAMGILTIVMMLVMVLLQIAIQACYKIFFLAKKGATPGKMLCRLKVVRPDGSALTYGRATGRFFAEWVTGFTCGIGYIIAAFDEEKRSLHDRIADTRVIQT